MPAEPEDARALDTEALGRLVRTLYVLNYRRQEAVKFGTPGMYGAKRMPRWDGGADSSGRKFKPVWPRIAQHLQSIDGDPERYIAAQFMDLGLDTPPFPNMLASAAATKKYREFARTFEQRLKQELLAQHGYLLMEIERLTRIRGLSETDATLTALADPLVSLSGLYRYCIAERIGERTLAERFHDGALPQYFCVATTYDRAWGDFIPGGLRDEVAKLRDSLMAGVLHAQ